MRITPVPLGMLIAASVTVGIAASQAETKMVDGRQQLVVASVNHGRVFEMPLARRFVWVGVPAGLLGAGIGYFASNGGSLGAAFLGALVLGGLSAGWRADWDDRFGPPGKHDRVSDSWLHGLVGGLIGAATAAHLAKHREGYPRRLPPSELSDLV
jgi:MFS family permease